MKATIDIRTPSGQSLEGYPITINDLPNNTDDLFGLDNYFHTLALETTCVNLHKGDTITIRIEE